MKTVVCLTCLLFPSFAFAQDYEIDWSKIGSGGGNSSGGIYQLSGTIAQLDTGTALSGGNYTMVEGFWSLFSPPLSDLPTVSIKQTSANTLQLSWPFPSSGFVVQQTQNIVANTWSALDLPIINDGVKNSVTLPLNSGTWFYRLKK